MYPQVPYDKCFRSATEMICSTVWAGSTWLTAFSASLRLKPRLTKAAMAIWVE